VFPRNPQPDATGDQDLQTGTSDQEPDEQRGGLDDLLEVVQHQQHMVVPQGLDQALCEWATARLADTERLGDGRRHEVRLGERRQVHEADAVGELRRQLGGHRQRQPGLAHSARTGQRHQTRIGAA
jgi:hypothetical protein